MKKGPLNFLGRKNQSLFGTNVEFKEMDKVELVSESAAIPESGTAKVRSRPTVKHFTSSDSVQGFAVPTPKVPILPPFMEPKINDTGSTTNLPKGRMLSVPDMIEGEILIPPPPISAPPPPPSSSAPPPPSFIPSPPQFFGDPSVNNARLQTPPMAPRKPPSLTGSEYSSDLDLASLKPPPMAPPKPPSETSSFRGSLSSLLEVPDIPECPKFTPPPPPGVKAPSVLPKSPKPAPPKPVRMSSISNLDIQSQTPEPPVASNPTPSSFNPQNTAKLYNIQKGTLLGKQTDREKVQSILMLEDSSGNMVGVVNGNSEKNGASVQPVQSVVPPTKPARRNSSATQLQNDQPDIAQAPSHPVEAKINPEPVTVQNIPTVVPTPIKVSPKIERKIPDVRQVMAPVESPGRSRRYSPITKHRQLNAQGVDGAVKKETSPFALLMAAKEREKQRTALSQKNSNPTEPVNSVIQPSVEKPNSFTVTPRDPTPNSPNVQLKSTTNVQPLNKAEVPKVSSSKPELFSTPQQSSPMNSSVGSLVVPIKDVESGEDLTFIPPPAEFANSDTEEEPPIPPPSHRAPGPPVKTSQPSKTLPTTLTPIINCPPPSHPAPVKTSSQPSKNVPTTPTPIINCPPPSHPAPVKTSSQPSKTLPAIPAPIINCPPPSHPAPAAPVQTAKSFLPTQITNGAPPSHNVPAPPPAKPSPPATPPPVTNGPLVSPKPKPPNCPPKAPGPPPNFQPQYKPVQTKPTQPPAQGPPSVSTSQATLLSILQKKMLEMDPKFSAAKEVESNGDDWNSPLSDDESPPAASNRVKTQSATLPAQSRGLDLKELESKAAKKAHNYATSAKSHNSNGLSSKQQFGMTFTVRPGSKQPITPVIKDGSP